MKNYPACKELIEDNARNVHYLLAGKDWHNNFSFSPRRSKLLAAENLSFGFFLAIYLVSPINLPSNVILVTGLTTRKPKKNLFNNQCV